MNKKAKSKKNKSARIKTAVQNFKKAIESKLGKINWGRVSIIVLFLLLTVASRGLLGPHPKAVAIVLFAAVKASKMA